MIATRIRIEYFRSEAKLFAFIDTILKEHALYHIDMADGFFVLSYWFGMTYRVLDSDYKLMFRLSRPKYGYERQLYWDDMLVLDGVALDRSWFYLPSLLIGQKEQEIIHARGYTPLGNVFNLVRAGVLQQVITLDGWAFDPTIPR